MRGVLFDEQPATHPLLRGVLLPVICTGITTLTAVLQNMFYLSNSETYESFFLPNKLIFGIIINEPRPIVACCTQKLKRFTANTIIHKSGSNLFM